MGSGLEHNGIHGHFKDHAEVRREGSESEKTSATMRMHLGGKK